VPVKAERRAAVQLAGPVCPFGRLALAQEREGPAAVQWIPRLILYLWVFYSALFA
jgi:hypothetical protein